VVCATLNNPDFFASTIPTIAEKVAQLMQPKIEQMVQEVVHPHLQPSLNKQCILEETISQLQDDNTKLNAKIDLIHMRLEEQEQYFRRTSLRFLNVRVPKRSARCCVFNEFQNNLSSQKDYYIIFWLLTENFLITYLSSVSTLSLIVHQL